MDFVKRLQLSHFQKLLFCICIIFNNLVLLYYYFSSAVGGAYAPPAVHMHRPAYFSGGAYAPPRKIKFGSKFLKNRFFNFILEKKQLNQKLYFFITKKTVFLRNFNSRISIFKKRISVFIKFVWAVHMHRPKNTLGGAYAPPTALLIVVINGLLIKFRGQINN